MRLTAMLLCTVLGFSSTRGEPLTSADREALLENLEKIREAADSKIDARFRAAIAAYRDAMATDEAAMDFYLKCIEKVNFVDQEKKSADFRDWKRKESEKHSSQSFRLALRYQLGWLILSLRASSEKANPGELAVDAQELVDSIFRDAVKLEGHGTTLGQPVTSTPFARAYEIDSLENEEWPLSPVQLEAVYGKVIFPQLRSISRLDSLRAAWIKRIQQEGIKEETLAGNGGAGKKRGQAGPNAEESPNHFATETLPELQWQMEMDLFRSGDESGAALRMLAHIQKHLSHKSVRDWGDQFKELLSPKPAVLPTPAAGNPSGN